MNRIITVQSLLAAIVLLWAYFQVDWATSPVPVAGRLVLISAASASIGTFLLGLTYWRRGY